MSLSTLPKIHPGRYRAVKQSVRTRCGELHLCDEAVTRCVDLAAKVLRNGRSAGIAIADGVALGKRLAGLRGRQAGHAK